jgi:hypothetical protein
MKKYFENLYSNKFNNIGEMDKFLGQADLPNLNQDDTNHLNKSMTSNKIEAVIVSQQGKSQDPTDSLPNSIRPLKKN